MRRPITDAGIIKKAISMSLEFDDTIKCPLDDWISRTEYGIANNLIYLRTGHGITAKKTGPTRLLLSDGKRIRADSADNMWKKLHSYGNTLAKRVGDISVSKKSARMTALPVSLGAYVARVREITGCTRQVVVELCDGRSGGKCLGFRREGLCRVLIGSKNGSISLATLIHEFLHAAGHRHKYSINRTGLKFMSRDDEYSPMLAERHFGTRRVDLAARPPVGKCINTPYREGSGMDASSIPVGVAA
ncbi:MAG: hypothetical protein MPK62_00915 [Alphaproteobacteria bacterium]|nr:hypothetical protein [Alphaproteobacteria bacterium]MDA8029695.1 hypothetical protein [Alphaproteobacteria bacterium]